MLLDEACCSTEKSDHLSAEQKNMDQREDLKDISAEQKNMEQREDLKDLESKETPNNDNNDILSVEDRIKSHDVTAAAEISVEKEIIQAPETFQQTESPPTLSR